jgi:formamidopyrimidine-DNA glycosylase
MVVRLGDRGALEATEQGTEKRLAIYLVRDLQQVAGIARLGVDALAEYLTAARLGELLRAQSGTLKNVLADQAVIAGIGNAYSDEILHAARLSPFRKAAGLDAEEVARLHTEMRAVLIDAVGRARTADPAELRGDKKLRMRVHGRTGEPCPVCGDVIRQVSYTSRSFQYCATCQTGGKVHADRRLSRLLR